MTSSLRVAGAQIDLAVGDLVGNEARIRDAMAWAADREAEVLLLPELATTGYPPEDLVLRSAFVQENLDLVSRLALSSGSVATVIGFVDRLDEAQLDDDSVGREVANAAAIIAGGAWHGTYRKVLLPNYGVFDEARYFAEGPRRQPLWEIGGVCCGVSVCEDIWTADGPPIDQAATGARILLNINGSPYHRGKGAGRARMLADRARTTGVPVVYLNTVGAQDELVFDGDSMVFDGSGELLYRAAQFEEELWIVDVPVPDLGSPHDGPRDTVVVTAGTSSPEPAAVPTMRDRLDDEAEVFSALRCGLHGYVTKNGFEGVVIGLSGGIDSALTATIAVDALGADRVWGVTMPSRYSSAGSVDDSRALAASLGCRFDVVGIDDVFGAFLSTLEPTFGAAAPNVAEENLQARIRGTVLMALSNKFDWMVVATGNKSEMAVGYATLYGDMAGGFAVLKDVSKTMVYRLARWRNGQDQVIPEAVIAKEPSAELRPDQRDSDSLPPYDLLDEILRRYVEEDRSMQAIVAEGFPADVVSRVATMVDRNEYKRRQAAPGVRVTEKAFGRDRRLPITSAFLDHGGTAAGDGL